MHDLGDVQLDYETMCAVRPIDNARVCWGNNTQTQLGDGTTTSTATPTAFDIGGIRALASEDRHSCALSTTGGVTCWGANYAGQSGLVPGGSVASPSGVANSAGPLANCTLVRSRVRGVCRPARVLGPEQHRGARPRR